MDSIGMTSGPLTMENIEAAMKGSLENFGEPDDMSAILKMVTFDARHIRLWKDLQKNPIAILREINPLISEEDKQAATDFLKQLREL